MTNRLAASGSPYLRQHADNPVDWYTWGDEALARARDQNKPILLSIGYSACHWCHVMAHESFEDPAVAAVMNEHFVNIKVDREERPDLDAIYQQAHAFLTRRSGGWPLTMFLTPDGTPYFAGTYFPKLGRHGMRGFLEILPLLAAAYRDQGEAIAEQARQLQAALASLDPVGGAGMPGDRAWDAALAGLARSFDPKFGGFGRAPKFPHPAELALCLQAYAATGDAQALAIARTTLAQMADGGIHDQLGGGFARYSVDAQWTIPHFEKMLYDNGPLLGLYADLARVTGERRHADVARDIVGWLVREMRAPDGAFHSSLDADSEGEEGKYYVWNEAEARAAVSATEWPVIRAYLGFDQPPNFEGHAWNPRVSRPLADVAEALAITLPDAQTRLVGGKAALFAARETRVRPGRDDKVLTSWNALAIAGLARASRAVDMPRLTDLALAAADAVRNTLWRDGRLLAARMDDRATLNAYLDDHAFLLAALFELMQSRFRVADFTWAQAIADALLARFEDPERGGFFFTSHDHERLIHRMKPGHDNATPSGNGIAAQALLAFGHLAGEARYIAAAQRTVRLFAEGIEAQPDAHTSLVLAQRALDHPPATVLLHGESAATADVQRVLERRYRPQVAVFDLAGVTDLPSALVKGPAPKAGLTAYVCRGHVCLPAVTSIEAIEDALDASGG